MNKLLIFPSVALVLLLVASKPALSSFHGHHREVTCEEVSAKLNACRTFVEKRADDPCPTCCAAVKDVKKWYKGEKSERALCTCLKKTFDGPDDSAHRVHVLPRKCDIDGEFPDPDDRCERDL